MASPLALLSMPRATTGADGAVVSAAACAAAHQRRLARSVSSSLCGSGISGGLCGSIAAACAQRHQRGLCGSIGGGLCAAASAGPSRQHQQQPVR